MERCSSLYRLVLVEDQVALGLTPVAHFTLGLSGSQRLSGACRSEGLVAGQHVPDRLGEAAGEIDLGDLGAALAAVPAFGELVALTVERMVCGVLGGLDQRPAQVPRSVFGERAA